jgi:putative membrane protein
MTTLVLSDVTLPTSQSPFEMATVVAAQMDGDDDHMGWDDGGTWVMVGFMAIFWLGILTIAAWGVATYARRGRRPEDSALETARRRYARGEINPEEFDRMKRDLE